MIVIVYEIFYLGQRTTFLERYTFSTNIRINKINGFCLQIQGTKRSGHQKQFFQYKLYCISNNKTGSESLTTKILLVRHEQLWLAEDSRTVGWRVRYLFSSAQRMPIQSPNHSQFVTLDSDFAEFLPWWCFLHNIFLHISAQSAFAPWPLFQLVCLKYNFKCISATYRFFPFLIFRFQFFFHLLFSFFFCSFFVPFSCVIIF